jgi:hypothetical protein
VHTPVRTPQLLELRNIRVLSCPESCNTLPDIFVPSKGDAVANHSELTRQCLYAMQSMFTFFCCRFCCVFIEQRSAKLVREWQPVVCRNTYSARLARWPHVLERACAPISIAQICVEILLMLYGNMPWLVGSEAWMRMRTTRPKAQKWGFHP